MDPLRLTCLGYPVLAKSDGTSIRIQTKKHLALLVYLSIEPSVRRRRDQIATLLWPAATLEDSRHSLATGLSLLRAHLGRDAFESERNTVRLRPGRVVTDVELLLLNDSSAVTSSTSVFLDGFEIPDSPTSSELINSPETLVPFSALGPTIAGT